ncbi:hypothetical protein HFO74_14050 [Rhizobium laguerreae]|uniref:D-isomer specific 2-hydroxyacid dehydrogenase NAD-binding domain-containing protein n=1 Tax=Rhizobium laguerreae TaxID=1076926 RepID=A0AB35FCQ9_9HYPH|nr:NAD(P)-dependent oxidoreductase [Rhizobium laguerreae]MBY3064546.1 hypothetical protein [Rhizobium laguerreae]
MNVLLADPFFATPEFKTALRNRVPAARVAIWGEDSIPNDVDVLATWTIPDDMRRLPVGLQAIFCFGAGAGHLLADERVPYGLPIVRNLDDGQAEQMLDYALHATLARQLDDQNLLIAQRQAAWERPRSARRQRGSLKVTILGNGFIGRRVSEGLAAYGFSVARWTFSAGDAIPGLYRGPDQLVDACRQADVLINVLPLSPDTDHILSSDVLFALRRGAYLVNIGRGSHVDDRAMLTAIDRGVLAAAWLDTFRREPLPDDDPLWSHPRIRITPHIGGLPTIDGSANALADVLEVLCSESALPGLVKRR